MTARGQYVRVGLNAAELRAVEAAHRDAQPFVTRCAFCPWTYTGTAQEGRELAKGHRRVKHPEVQPARRRRGTLRRFNPRDSFRDDGLANAAEVAAMHARRETAATEHMRRPGTWREGER